MIFQDNKEFCHVCDGSGKGSEVDHICEDPCQECCGSGMADNKETAVVEDIQGVTPGPWEAEFGDEPKSDGAVTTEGGTVAHVPIDLIGYEANARLIAAAPDLLEVTIEALEQLYVEHAEVCEQTDDCGYFDTYLRMKAAIAKATGTEKATDEQTVTGDKVNLGDI